jgi:hypothetical protein
MPLLHNWTVLFDQAWSYLRDDHIDWEGLLLSHDV